MKKFLIFLRDHMRKKAGIFTKKYLLPRIELMVVRDFIMSMGI